MLDFGKDINFLDKVIRACQATGNFSIITSIALYLLEADKSVKINMKSTRYKAAGDNDYIIHLLNNYKNRCICPGVE